MPISTRTPLIGEQTMQIDFAEYQIHRVVSQGELKSGLHARHNPVGR